MRPTSAHSGLRGPPLSLCDIMQRGYLQQVRMLVELGSNLESRDASGRTPLMLTAYVQPEEWGVGVARLLIESEVNMAARDRYGMHVLHHACVYERLELAKVLLNAADFDLAQPDKFGNTPLHYAAMSGNVPLVKLVLTYLLRYRLPLDKVNKNNRTALEEAVHNGNDVCAAIIKAAMSYSGSSGKTENDSVCESSPPFAASPENSFSQPEISIRVLGTGETDSRAAFQKVDLLRQDFLIQHMEGQQFSPPDSERSSLSKSRRSGIRRPHTASLKRPSSAGSSSSGGSMGRPQTQSLLNGRHGGSSTNLAFNGTNVGADSANNANTNRRLSARPPTAGRAWRESTSISRPSSLQSLKPYDKNPEKVIYVASENDFRNTPEYVLKLTKMAFDPCSFDTDGLPILVKKTSTVSPGICRDEIQEKKTGGPPSWRDDMRKLYKHYEVQCSPSWRNAARPPVDPMLLASPSTQGEEMEESGSVKEKKGRRPSSVMRLDLSTGSAIKRKLTTHRQRKTSNVSPPSGNNRAAGASPDSCRYLGEGGLADFSIASSNESLSSANSNMRKKDNSTARTDAGGSGAGANSSDKGLRGQGKSSSDHGVNGKGSGSETNVSAAASRGGSASSAGSTPGTANGSAGSTNGNSAGSGNAQMRGKRPGTSNTHTVPLLTATPADGETDASTVNAEPEMVDSNRLAVLSDIDEV